ncbi:unnamed protein product [Toxocara canis]|uniref:KASH domain-containing protein n=1 Tax=Toxocara canis TaxID=6265 RepID=A0A183UMU8_TOXCA|nr:unnamed protein product [Toxocara canis]
MHADAEQLISKLAALIAEANKLLNDSEAHPAMYRTIADEFVLPLEHVEQLLKDASSEDVQLIPLNALVPEAKDVHSALLRRADIWRQFVAERDAGNDQLEAMRRPLHEIISKPRRTLDEVLHDLETLKMFYSKWPPMAELSSRLLSLSSELHPLSIAVKDARLFADNTGIVEHRLEPYVITEEAQLQNLLDSLSAEFHVREELVRSLAVISHELDDIRASFNGQRVHTRQLLSYLGGIFVVLYYSASHIQGIWLQEIRHQLQGIRAHLTLLNEDISKFNDNRLYLIEEDEISTQRNFDHLEQIEEALKSVEVEEEQPDYDIDAAAEVLAAVFPDRDPRSVMREQGIPFDDLSSSDGCKSDLEVEVEEGEAADVALSPIPDDPAPARSHYERQRSRWRRILRTALPLQAMLVLLLGAACLVPHCDDEYCCQLLNNFARSFDPSLDFVNGPPPF